MNAEQICWWIQGYIDLTEAEGDTLSMSADQVERIKSKLSIALKLPAETNVKSDVEYVAHPLPKRHWMETIGPVTPTSCIPTEQNINRPLYEGLPVDGVHTDLKHHGVSG